MTIELFGQLKIQNNKHGMWGSHELRQTYTKTMMSDKFVGLLMLPKLQDYVFIWVCVFMHEHARLLVRSVARVVSYVSVCVCVSLCVCSRVCLFGNLYVRALICPFVCVFLCVFICLWLLVCSFDCLTGFSRAATQCHLDNLYVSNCQDT